MTTTTITRPAATAAVADDPFAPEGAVRRPSPFAPGTASVTDSAHPGVPAGFASSFALHGWRGIEAGYDDYSGANLDPHRDAAHQD